MLIEFTVANYRSFLDPATLSLQAAPLRAQSSEVDSKNLLELDDMRLLKVAGIYGPNASGKSNLIQALFTMKKMVFESSRSGQVDDTLLAEPFRLTTEPAPGSYFEVVLANSEDQYRYGFRFSVQEVVEEWLYRRPRHKSREHRLFSREGREFKFHQDFQEGRALRDKTRSNALHLSVCAQFDGPLAKQVLRCFDRLRVVNGLESTFHVAETIERLKKNDGSVKELVQRLDVGISDLSVEKLEFEFPKDFPESLQQRFDNTETVLTSHRVFDSEGEAAKTVVFSIDNESAGTQKAIALAGPITSALKEGKAFIIDEFDARLHPLLSEQLIDLFQSSETNPKGAQLIFTTHDTNLLRKTLFRRDQLWFVEKHPHEASSDLYSLAEIRIEESGVRNDASFEKDYLQGRYGAVPFFGNLGASLSQYLTAESPQESEE